MRGHERAKGSERKRTRRKEWILASGSGAIFGFGMVLVGAMAVGVVLRFFACGRGCDSSLVL